MTILMYGHIVKKWFKLVTEYKNLTITAYYQYDHELVTVIVNY